MCLTPCRVLAVSVLLATQAAFGQLSRSLDRPGSIAPAPWISPSRLLAGLRAYSPDHVRAFLVVVEYPGIVGQLADDPELFEHPANVKGVISADVAAAIQELRVMPEIVLVAAEHPTEFQVLRRLRREAPEGVALRLEQLRENYGRLTLTAAAAWQGYLVTDPVALGEYRELLTRFCGEQRQLNAEFPCISVTDRQYYYTCVPNEVFMQYARKHCRLTPLRIMLEKWWAYCRPERIDARAQWPGWDYRPRVSVPDNGPEELKELLQWYRSAARGVREADPEGATVLAPPRTAGGLELVAALPVERRAAMWKEIGAADAEAIGLVPVIIQPLADQPPEARRQYAVAEHARLWSFHPRLVVLADPPDDGRADGDVEVVPQVGPGEQRPLVEGGGPWREMTEVGVRAPRDRDQRSSWRTYRSCYDRGGYYYGGVRLHYGDYGGYWDYSWLGWPYTRSDLHKLRTLYEITPGGWRLGVYGLGYGYGRRTYVESDGVRVRVGPTTYYYRWPTSSRIRGTATNVGVRRHYRSATRQIGRGLRPYPTYGGRISGAQRRSANQRARGIRRVPQRFGTRGTTIGNRRPITVGSRNRTTIGTRGPTVIRHRQPRAGSSRSSLDRYRRTGQTRPRAGIQRSHELRRSQHGVRSSSPRGQRSSRSGLSRRTSRTSGRNELRRSNNRTR